MNQHGGTPPQGSYWRGAFAAGRAQAPAGYRAGAGRGGGTAAAHSDTKGDTYFLNGMLNDQSLIYQQIAKRIEDGILQGAYAENEQVPSTTELARTFNINPATAAKGVNRLVDEGLLYKKRGIGMFVAEGAAAVLHQKRQRQFAGDQVARLAKEAKRLGLSKAQLLAMVSAAADGEELK